MTGEHIGTLITAIAVAPRPSYPCRLWEVQLKDNNQEWAAAGIVPVSGRKQGQTWKELVETACKLESWMPEHLPAFAHTLDFTSAPYSKLHALECVREMWNSGDHYCTCDDRHKKERVVMICLLMSAAGKPTVHIDFCFCCVTARDWSSGALPMTFKLAYLRVLLDVVYFFWYDERQLARGAIFLRKVDASGAARCGAVLCLA